MCFLYQGFCRYHYGLPPFYLRMRSHLLWKGGKKGAMCKPMMQNKMRVFTIERSEFLLQKAILIFLFLVFILELNPVTSSQAAELRLYENTDFRGDYLTYYALQQNGCLTAWGAVLQPISSAGPLRGMLPLFPAGLPPFCMWIGTTSSGGAAVASICCY